MHPKPYLNDAYTQTFRASVLDCIKTEGAYKVVLDHTYFYPEGGGQPADTGVLGNQPVLDVSLESNTVYHHLPQPLEIGHEVEGHIDWHRRFDHMQQHSGQHLLSAVLFRQHQAQTVGFHLTHDNLTIDIDRLIPLHLYDDIVSTINGLIQQNLPLHTHYPDQETLKSLAPRKSSDKDDLRIIEIEAFDSVPCGGTHVKRLGEIGLITLLKVEKYKKGQRLTVACGQRAIKHVLLTQATASLMIERLATPLEGLNAAIEAHFETVDALKKALLDHQLASLDLKVDALLNQTTPQNMWLFQWFEDLSSKAFKKFVEKLTQATDKSFVLGTYHEGSGQVLVRIGPDHPELSAKDVLAPLLKSFDLRGGGSDQMAQAGSKAYQPLKDAYQTLIKNH